MTQNKRERIVELERKIADLRSRMPAHSVKPEMIMELERLEGELEELMGEDRARQR